MKNNILATVRAITHVALATSVETDSHRPFAPVIISGLFSRLFISVFVMPVLFEMVAREGDHLEV